MTSGSAAAAFELEAFERLVATPGTVLLRVAGRWRAGSPVALEEPVLRAGDRLVAPLPGPSAPHAGPDAPHWGAAYAVPAHVAEGAAFALEVGPWLVSLPAPVERASAEPRPSVEVAALQERAAEVAAMAREALREAGPLRDRVAELEERLASRDDEIDELRRRCDDAEAAAAAEASARRRAEAEADGLARRLEEAEASRDQARAAARDAEATARDAVEAGRLREVPAPAASEEPAAPPDREHALVVTLFVVALLAGVALVALELTHVLDLAG
jgi:hypothetical protein